MISKEQERLQAERPGSCLRWMPRAPLWCGHHQKTEVNFTDSFQEDHKYTGLAKEFIHFFLP